MSTVSQFPESQTQSETVLDGMIRAGASTGLGWEDVEDFLMGSQFGTHVGIQQGRHWIPIFPQGHRRGT